MNERVWPVGKPSLRHAGEGLEDQKKQTFLAFAGWSLALFCSGALALGLIIGPYLPPQIRLWAVAACLGVGIFALTVPMVAADRKMDRVIAGLLAERRVGEALKALERQGAYVLHDVRGPIGNIDHVLIHTSGVYAIETKHRSRFRGGWMQMTFDGQQFRINGQPISYDPLPQATRQAAWLRQHLTVDLHLALRAPVKAVVLFPGWSVDVTSQGSAPVQVMSVRDFLASVQNCPDRQVSDKQAKYFHDLLAKAQQPKEEA